MKKNVLFIALITMFLTIGFACGGGGIVGSWEYAESDEFGDMVMTMTFKADGTWESKMELKFKREAAEAMGEIPPEVDTGKYVVEGDTIKTWEEGSTSEEPDDVVKFKIEGSELTVFPEGAAEGAEMVFTRK